MVADRPFIEIRVRSGGDESDSVGERLLLALDRQQGERVAAVFIGTRCGTCGQQVTESGPCPMDPALRHEVPDPKIARWERAVLRAARAGRLLEIAAGFRAQTVFDNHYVCWQTQVCWQTDPGGREHRTFEHRMSLEAVADYQGHLGDMLCELLRSRRGGR